MIISDLEFYLVAMECRQRSMPIRSLIVRLTTDTGIDGWGESELNWRVDELAPRREALLPILAGRSVYDIEELLGLDALADSPPLRSALEMASWDLIGRLAEQPLCRLLGGEYRRRLPLAIRLLGDSTEQIAAMSRELADQGFHTQILPAWGRPLLDRERLAAISAMSGDRVELILDGQASFSLESAREFAADISEDQPLFLLDPLASLDAHQIAKLRRQINVPVAVARSIHCPADVLATIRSGAAEFLVVDHERVGGISAAKKCAAVAEAAGLSAAISSGPSLGIKFAAILQVASSTPAFSLGNESIHQQLGDDLLAEPFEIADGMIAVPHGPGLGIEVDRAKLEKYQVG